MGVRFTMWAVDAGRLIDVLTAEEVASAAEDSLLLQRALRRLSGAAEARGVAQLLLDGHRRWWVGSVLESSRPSWPWLRRDGDLDHVESLLAFMLRGWSCGTAVRSVSPTAFGSSFPIVPKADADLRMAVLSWSDFELLRLYLDERLRDEHRRFVRPSGAVGIGPGSDDEWDAWVREVLRDLAMTPLEAAAPSLVSFLG